MTLRQGCVFKSTEIKLFEMSYGGTQKMILDIAWNKNIGQKRRRLVMVLNTMISRLPFLRTNLKGFNFFFAKIIEINRKESNFIQINEF